VLEFEVFPFMRELMMIGFVALSLATTPGGIRAENNFNYLAIGEVAALFVGIFIAMQVPVEVLNVKGPALGLSQPWHFFWTTGSLSSVLDNAPTYVVFFETANAMAAGEGPGIMSLGGGKFIQESLLVGVSLGAVFMGSMTYIGNGPNFMVKAIAEQEGIPMPSFFAFLFRYSLPILVPVFVLITLIFCRA
jgi:Na+/H+ antiporter NhaD/arsenite permease-like protein